MCHKIGHVLFADGVFEMNRILRTLRLMLIGSGLLVFPTAGVTDDAATAQGEYLRNILPMRQRVQAMEDWWKRKKQTVLPQLMREQSVDMGIVRNDEADKYYTKMPWIRIPFSDKDRSYDLFKLFNLIYIPNLVIIDPDFNVVNINARYDVEYDPSGTSFPWHD